MMKSALLLIKTCFMRISENKLILDTVFLAHATPKFGEFMLAVKSFKRLKNELLLMVSYNFDW